MESIKKRPLKFFFRVLHLLFAEQSSVLHLVQKSYDRISVQYDDAWTSHMRDRSEELIEHLNPKTHQKALDLTCGTGFVTHLLSDRTQQKTIGVDISEGMLAQARKNYGHHCEFVQSDILTYLHTLPPDSLDVVTCCWGLGYSKPFAVVKQIKRVLKKGGKFAIIDNSLFSLFEVLYCSCLAFLEKPQALNNIMRFRFLSSRKHLSLWLRLAGLKPLDTWQDKKTYTVDSGEMAIDRLRSTGAAAGFEYAAKPEYEQEIFARFAQIMEQKYLHDGKITITHRYLAGIAEK